ncbi:MAG: hypothetical protein FJZ01_06640 [Candidatus Sericytochromatia bacterium]|nr:hypothetical protein [Candidatus Tanganyikabacteria bacterium]
MSRTARLSLILLAATIAPTLAGCGSTAGIATPANSAGKTQTQAARPSIPTLDRAKLQSTKDGISASSYYTVDRARRRASDALWRYQDLREDWQRAWSDDEKDRIEQRMLVVLTDGGTDIRRMTANSWDYDDRRLNDMAERMLQEYDYLRREWQQTWDTGRKREIVNQMLIVLTRGLQEVANFYRSR